ncbi:MAG: hypothetical protein LUC31_02410 [Coprobacillus sp.]|nr:hypothetical protein [Coprobacillus sp.]
MKKYKILTFTGLLAVSLGCLTGCGLFDDTKGDSGKTNNNNNNNTSSDEKTGFEIPVDDTKGYEEPEDVEDSGNTGETSHGDFTVKLNGLNSWYYPDDEIDWSGVSLTLTYDDLTEVQLRNLEFDVDEAENEETEAIINTAGLYAQSQRDTDMVEGTYAISYAFTYDDVQYSSYILIVTVTYLPTSVYDVFSFEDPQLKITYEQNLQRVEYDMDNSAENQFYVAPDYYEVGDDNPFTFQPELWLYNKTTSQTEIPSSYHVNESVYLGESTEVPNLKLDLDNNQYVSVSGFDFQFTEEAIGKVFTIVVELVGFNQDIASNPIQPITFTVKVQDGWNVYDALDLGRLNLVPDDFDDGWSVYSSGTNADTSYDHMGREYFESAGPGGYRIWPHRYYTLTLPDGSTETCSHGGNEYVAYDEVPEGADPANYELHVSLTYAGPWCQTDWMTAPHDNSYETSGNACEYWHYMVKPDVYWKNFLEEKGRENLQPVNGMFIHSDLMITQDVIPPEFFVTADEAYYLGPEVGASIVDMIGDLGSFDSMVETLVDSVLGFPTEGDPYVYDEMVGAVRDRSYIYNHHMNHDFLFDGNLFKINGSSLKWGMNNVFYAQINGYYPTSAKFSIQGNSCWFVFDQNRNLNNADDIFDCTFKNVEFMGNSKGYVESGSNNSSSESALTDSERASGSLSFLMSHSSQVFVDNVIVKNANIAFWSQTNRSGYTPLKITNSKVYDCYTTAFYVWLGGVVEVSHSEFKRFGGTASILISGACSSSNSTRHPYDTENKYSGLSFSDDCIIDCPVGGTESWFSLNNASTLVTQVKGYDTYLNALGKSLVDSDDKMNITSLFMDEMYILSGTHDLFTGITTSTGGSYAINSNDTGEDTDDTKTMQYYIENYAVMEDNTVLGGLIGSKYSVPLFITNTGKILGWYDSSKITSSSYRLDDIIASDAQSSAVKASTLSSEDTECLIVLPCLQDGLSVNSWSTFELILDLVAAVSDYSFCDTYLGIVLHLYDYAS